MKHSIGRGNPNLLGGGHCKIFCNPPKKHENPLEQTKLTLEAWLTQDSFCICCFIFIIIIIIIIPCSVVASLRKHTHTDTTRRLETWGKETHQQHHLEMLWAANHWLPFFGQPLRPLISGGYGRGRCWLIDQQKLGGIFITSWWFQPIWKILVKLDHFPR